MAKRAVKVLIDRKLAGRLLDGKTVTVRLPEGATELEITMAPVGERNHLNEIFDTFFNGRPAR